MSHALWSTNPPKVDAIYTHKWLEQVQVLIFNNFYNMLDSWDNNHYCMYSRGQKLEFSFHYFYKTFCNPTALNMTKTPLG